MQKALRMSLIPKKREKQVTKAVKADRTALQAQAVEPVVVQSLTGTMTMTQAIGAGQDQAPDAVEMLRRILVASLLRITRGQAGKAIKIHETAE